MPEGVLPRPYAKSAVTLSTMLPESVGTIWPVYALAASVAIGTAKLVMYFPLVLISPMSVAEFFWVNGTVIAGHIQMAVYNEAFTRLGANGTTTSQSGGSATQTVAPASAFTLPGPARYYLAITSDDATSTFAMHSSAPAAGVTGGLGIMTETTAAFGLTDPGVPAVSTTEFLVLCGISGSTVG